MYYLLGLSRLAERGQIRHPVAANADSIDPNHAFAHFVHPDGDRFIAFRSIKSWLQEWKYNHPGDQNVSDLNQISEFYPLPWTMKEPVFGPQAFSTASGLILPQCKHEVSPLPNQPANTHQFMNLAISRHQFIILVTCFHWNPYTWWPQWLFVRSIVPVFNPRISTERGPANLFSI